MRKQLVQQAGFTLIEAMLAAVILGGGLLMLSGMQAISLGRNIDANELTAVTSLATEMLDRISQNHVNVTAYNGLNTAVGCTGAVPPPTQVQARGDCQQWQQALQNLSTAALPPGPLGAPVGTVNVVLIDPDPATNPTSLGQRRVDVRITWTGGTRSETSTTRTKTVVMSKVMTQQ